MSKLRFVVQVINSLISREGGKINFYHVLTNGFNVQTGVPDRQYNVIAIKKALVLPLEKIRAFKYDLSFIAANKNFTFGGEYDTNTFIGIIRLKDMKGIVPVLDDHIIYETVKYQIKKVIPYPGEGIYEMILIATDSASKEKFAFAETKVEFGGRAT